MAINNVIVSGNLVKDCEKKQLGETPAIEFAIAVNGWRNGEEVPNYFDCTMFGNRAKSIAKFMCKGVKVVISGRLVQDKWQDKEGNNRSKVKIIANDVDFVSPKKDENEADNVPW